MKRPLFWIGLTVISSTAVFLHFSTAAALVFCIIISSAASYLAAKKFSIKRIPVLFSAALLAGCWLGLSQFVRAQYMSAVTDTSDEYAVIYATVTECRPYAGYQTLSAYADISVGTETRSSDINLSGSFDTAPFRGEVICCLASYDNERYIIKHFLNHDGTYVHPHISAAASIQRAVGQKLDTLFDEVPSAVLSALIVGDDTKLSDDIISDFRDSSLSHLLVVSGMHLLIISHTLSLILRRFLSDRISSVISLLFCWGFAALSGFGVSIVRAAVMLTVMNIGAMLNRKNDTLTSMMVAAVLIVLSDPFAATSASFLLSFSAVAGLALFQKPIFKFICRDNYSYALKSITESLSAAAAAQLATSPVCAMLFKSVPLLGTAANIAAVWLLQPIMLLGVVSLAIGSVLRPLAVPFIFLCEKLIMLLLFIAKLFASIPFITLHFTEYWQFVWLAAALLLSVTVFCRAPFRKAVFASAAGLSAIYAAAAIFSFALNFGCADILIFEQSGCAAAVKGSHAVLLGTPQDRRQRSEITYAFSVLGVERLDAIVINDSADLNYSTVKLSEDFGCHDICAPNDRTSAAFCHTSGLNLNSLPENAELFDKLSLTADDEGYKLIFKSGKLLKSGTNCDIITGYSYPMQIKGAVRYRITL